MQLIALSGYRSILKTAVLLAFLMVSFISGRAQVVDTSADSVIIEAEDTVLMKSYAARFNPKKALLFAAVVPGLGQVYNKKYWKVPLVYGGIAAMAWNIDRFHTFYVLYKTQLFENLEMGLSAENDKHPESGLTTRQLRSAVDKAKYKQDFWMIMMGAMYLLQIVDAHVDAHLKEFDLNPNLRVSVQPVLQQDQLLGRQNGVSLTIKF